MHPWGVPQYTLSVPRELPAAPQRGLAPLDSSPGTTEPKLSPQHRETPTSQCSRNFRGASDISPGYQRGVHQVQQQQEWGTQHTAGTGCISKAAKRLIYEINAAKNIPSCLSSELWPWQTPAEEETSAWGVRCFGQALQLSQSCQHP